MSYTYTTPTYHANITLSPTSIVTGSPYTIGIASGANGTSASDLNWSGTSWTTTPVTISQKASIDLRGEDADIVINGESLKETLQAIKDALKIPGRIQQDAKLEESFQELRQLREQYEQSVKDYKEKQKVWETLKNQDL